MSTSKAVQMQSFTTADNRPILLENYSKSNEDANRRLKVDEIFKKDETDILSDLKAGKRKRTQTSSPKKKARKESTLTKKEDCSDSESIDWSDEEGFTKNLSIIEASFKEPETSTSFSDSKQLINDDDDINWSDDEFILKL